MSSILYNVYLTIHSGYSAKRFSLVSEPVVSLVTCPRSVSILCPKGVVSYMHIYLHSLAPQVHTKPHPQVGAMKADERRLFFPKLKDYEYETNAACETHL